MCRGPTCMPAALVSRREVDASSQSGSNVGENAEVRGCRRRTLLEGCRARPDALRASPSVADLLHLVIIDEQIQNLT